VFGSQRLLIGLVVTLTAASPSLAEFSISRGAVDQPRPNNAKSVRETNDACHTLVEPTAQVESELHLEVIKSMLIGTATIALGAALAIWINDHTSWGKEFDET
jgi:hypothetical protein